MSPELMATIAGLQSELAAKMAKVAALEDSLTELAHENALLKRRLFDSKTERGRTSEFQLALGDLLASEAKLQADLEASVEKAKDAAPKAEPAESNGSRACARRFSRRRRKKAAGSRVPRASAPRPAGSSNFVGNIGGGGRLTHVKQILFFVFLSLWSRLAAAETANENFFGYWTWSSGTGTGITYANPNLACKELVHQLAENQPSAGISFRGVRRGANPDYNNDYTCLWKRDDDGSNQESTEALDAVYNCVPRSSVITLNNSARIADHRCRCYTGTCYPLSPPAIDTSDRCKAPHPPMATLTPGARLQSEVNRELAAAFATASGYNAIANELAMTDTCTFTNSDFYKSGGENVDVNIGFLCGFRDGDEAAANKVAGFASTPDPDNYVWHHALKLGRMQLVKKTAHANCGSHWGGVAAWKEALGIFEYPLHLPPLL